MSSTRENMTLMHSLPLPSQRQRARIHWIPALCALATSASVLFWLSQHRFMEQPHHYVTALVIVGWLASLPFVFLYRFTIERRNYHGDF